jgi:hypothetical protein
MLPKECLKGLVCSPCDCDNLGQADRLLLLFRGHGSKENEKELQQFKDGLAKQF